jgi:uncharacterized membrane protein YidH (DUF202 family)
MARSCALRRSYPGIVLVNLSALDTEKSKNISDHLANERTFPAWIRTSVGIMALGFVVVKFGIILSDNILCKTPPFHTAKSKFNTFSNAQKRRAKNC